METSYLQRSLLAGVLVAVALVVIGRLLIPSTSLASVAAALIILVAYGGLAVYCPSRMRRRDPELLRWALFFGLLAGAVFTIEIVLEYILLPINNSRFGLVEFGTVFTLYFASGLAMDLRIRSIKNAAISSVAAAIIASLIWVIVVLTVFFAFRGSVRQELVLRAEGDFEDFIHSGMKDFNTFIMEDFLGATFFHLLLGPLVAAALGALGGLLGKSIRAFYKVRGRPT